MVGSAGVCAACSLRQAKARAIARQVRDARFVCGLVCLPVRVCARRKARAGGVSRSRPSGSVRFILSQFVELHA